MLPNHLGVEPRDRVRGACVPQPDPVPPNQVAHSYSRIPSWQVVRAVMSAQPHTPKDLPQPHVSSALGLKNEKPPPMSASE